MMIDDARYAQDQDLLFIKPEYLNGKMSLGFGEMHPTWRFVSGRELNRFVWNNVVFPYRGQKLISLTLLMNHALTVET